MKVIVIIPAAGLGIRMAAGAALAKAGNPAAVDARTAGLATAGDNSFPAAKQFLELHGSPIIIHTLRKFAACRQVDRIYVALRSSQFSPLQSRLHAEKAFRRNFVYIVEGGDHRQHSVANALAAIDAGPRDIILVHDAVRPFVDLETITRVIHAAENTGAAIAGIPASDTVKQVERNADGALITATLPRERLVMAQTPQGFRYEILKKAFAEAAADGFIATDESALVERSGHPVVVVMGSPQNIKITTPADLKLAEFLLRETSPGDHRIPEGKTTLP